MDRSSMHALACALGVTCGSLALLPTPALACGGFFCSSAPIVQAGETVIYGLEDDGSVVMTVQIQYAGDDDDFAWILPVPVPPTSIALGSDALFVALEGATRPTFSFSYRTEGVCATLPTCYTEGGAGVTEPSWASYGGGCGGGRPRPIAVDAGPRPFVPVPPVPPVPDAGAFPDGGPPRDAGVEVYSTESVGPYETVVLGAATADAVVTWLVEHGYSVPLESSPLLEAYAAAGQVFVALRLRPQRTTSMLRPIVLHLPTSEACLPIRLTAIATVPDMRISAIFLGDARVVSRNYALAEPVIGIADIDLWQGSLTWTERVTEEVNRLGGRAFVTDYAGPRPEIAALALPDVLDLATEMDPAVVIRTLAARGYARDPALASLLAVFVAPPASSTAAAYYTCLTSAGTRTCGVPAHYDPAGLVAAVDEQITAPRRAAEALVARHPYVTRLETTMSAFDMTLDPVFVEDAGLESVSSAYVANVVTRCSSEYLESGAPRDVAVGGTSVRESAGEPFSAVEYCHARGLRTAAEVPASVAAPAPAPAPPSPPPPAPRTSRGCGCRTLVASPGAWRGGVLLAAALAIVLRRRDRRRA